MKCCRPISWRAAQCCPYWSWNMETMETVMSSISALNISSGVEQDLFDDDTCPLGFRTSLRLSSNFRSTGWNNCEPFWQPHWLNISLHVHPLWGDETWRNTLSQRSRMAGAGWPEIPLFLQGLSAAIRDTAKTLFNSSWQHDANGLEDWVIIGSDNGLVPIWHQAIIWTNDDLPLIKPHRIVFCRNSGKIPLQQNAFKFNIVQSPVDSPYKGPTMPSYTVSLLLSWTNSWTNSQVASDLRFMKPI